MKHTLTLILLLSYMIVGAQDRITFKNGEELEAYVLQVNDEYILYQLEKNTDQKPLKASISSVFMIKYENGTKYVIQDQNKKMVRNDVIDVKNLTIPAFTSIYIENTQEIRSKSLVVNQIIPFMVAEDLIVDGQVIVTRGTPVNGRVTRVTPPKFLGRPGDFEVQVKEVESIDGTMIPLVGNVYLEGKDKSTEVIILGAIVFWPILLIKGNEAIVPQHTLMRVDTRDRVVFR
jgi:hypothetical protein